MVLLTGGAMADMGAGNDQPSFSTTGRSLAEEDEIQLTSVGVDIGSSTSHLLFSTIVLQQMDNRYVVTGRRILRESHILLTPYAADGQIDARALETFIHKEYAEAGLEPADIDTGALILTGVAARRRNARAIGELFSSQAGKFVAASAGDGLECLIAAHGSGAVGLSAAADRRVLNIDVGGGTTKIALCEGGRAVALTAVDAGARLVVLDPDGCIVRLEPFGRRYLEELGLPAAIGAELTPDQRGEAAAHIAARIHAAATGAEDDELEGFLRLPPLAFRGPATHVTFSGGVSEYIYGHTREDFGDLGPELARSLVDLFRQDDVEIVPVSEGIRATVIGASQYTVQMSGSTIFYDPPGVLPIRNVPVIRPELALTEAVPDETAVAAAIADALLRHDLATGDQPAALMLHWSGSATFHRLQALSRGIIAGLEPVLAAGHPLILVVDDDIGGLIGIHCRREEGLENPLVSIDGIELKEFDFLDIGEVLHSTGAVPVAIKSLLFPRE